ncbi:MAG: histidine kinase [Clostridium sp.]|nr:histidine kinase [Clostridium sp.]
MNKKITTLFMVISLLIMYLEIGYKEIILMNSIFIIALCIFQLLKNLFKVPFKIVTFIQIFILLISIKFLSKETFLLFPILFFELVKDKLSIEKEMIFLSVIMITFLRKNIAYLIIYTIILTLYLYEIKEREEESKNLKDIKKDNRKEKFIMEEKVTNFNRYLEQNQVVISLRERNIMAQKLHDHLGHRITSSIMQLEVTKETLGKNNEMSMKYLLSAMENLRVGMEEIRTVLRNVKPKDRTITIENIKKLLLEFQYNSGIKTHFHLEGEVEKLGVKRLIVIEENIKEALTNALKYSKASQINVSILIYNKVARIEIKDNGQGSSNIKKGLGLIGMEERLEKINGNMKIDGSDGFTLNMILNLEDK